jgi:hypothetical protein
MDLKREEEIGGGWEELDTNHRRRQQSSAAEKGERGEVAVYNSGHNGKEGGKPQRSHHLPCSRACSRALAPALHAASLHPEKRPIRPHRGSQVRG